MSSMKTLVAKPPPLRLDDSGTLRVGKTRVPIDTVVNAFENGSTPEEIVLGFDTLRLADVYAVISFYLENRAEVAEYMAKRASHAEEVRAEREARFPTAEIRERVLARHKDRG